MSAWMVRLAAARERVEKTSRALQAAQETHDEALDRLLAILREGDQQGEGGESSIPEWGVIGSVRYVPAARGAAKVFLDGSEESMLLTGVVLATLKVLLCSAARAADGNASATWAQVADGVAAMLKRPRQSREAVHTTVSRLRKALSAVREDAEELLFYDPEVRGWRLSAAIEDEGPALEVWQAHRQAAG